MMHGVGAHRCTLYNAGSCTAAAPRCARAMNRRSLVAIYKKLGRYNPLLGAALRVYFFLLGFGVDLTLEQSAIVFAIASVSLAVLCAGAVLYLYL